MIPPQFKASSWVQVEGALLTSSLGSSDRTRGNGTEMHWLKFRLNIRERHFNLSTRGWSLTGTGSPWKQSCVQGVSGGCS